MKNNNFNEVNISQLGKIYLLYRAINKEPKNE